MVDCQLNASYSPYPGGFWMEWYPPVPNMPTSFDWGEVLLERNYYRWHLTCNGAGGKVDADFFANVY